MKITTFTCMGLLAFVLIGLSSCNRENSEDVNQDKIWTHYELFYNDNEGKSYARATFRFSNASGTRLELSDGAEVRFNDDLIPWNNGIAYYEMELAGFQTDGTFEYTDLEGNTYTNSISVPTINFPAGLDSVPRTEAYELVWEGDELSLGEVASVFVDGDFEGDAHLFVESSVGASSIVMAADDLGELPEGPANWYMERSYTPGIQQSTSASGVIVARYRCENIEVVME